MEKEKEQLLLTVVTCSSVLILKHRQKRKRSRTLWVKEWLKNREEKGAFNNILNELKMIDLPYYRRFIRMNPDTFKVLITDLCYLFDFGDISNFEMLVSEIQLHG